MKNVVVVLLVAGFVTSVLAQDAPAARPAPQAQAQPAPAPGAQRAGAPQDRGPGRGPMGVAQMSERLAEQLNLDEAQRVKFDAIVKKYEQQRTQAGQGDDLRALMEEMRKAREAGDDARVQELRQQMRDMRGGPGAGMQPFFDEVKGILRQDQLAKFEEIRTRMMERMGPPGGPQAMRQLMSDLRDELKLDQGQQQKFDELAQALRNPSAGQAQEMQDLREQMRAAREAGDQAKMDELRRQMEANRPNQSAALEKFFNELAPILNDSQKPTLEKFRERAREMDQGGGNDDLRTILRAASRLNLDETQRQQIRDIQREAQEAGRDIAVRDTEARKALAEKTKEKIKAILTPEQAQEFEKNLSAGAGRPGRGDAAGNDERPRRNRGANGPK